MSQQKAMTKEHAMQILTNATAVYKGSREEHQLIQLALIKLNELVEAPEPPKE
jgi:hypothetical protein